MASTDEWSRRYMKQFVFLPLNLHPSPRRALLISFGSGSTAKALRDVEDLTAVDVVDISRDILGLSDVVYPDPAENPLADPRFESHVGDGRFFLLATDRRYDLITSEPPPPKHAGVENLYTQEFFALVRDRLAEGGINSHWLPTHALTYDDTRAIVRAYCAVFEDCTLWRGINLNWMLMGSRNAKCADDGIRVHGAMEVASGGAGRADARGRGSGASSVRCSWGDAETLGRWTAGVAPLVDGFPKRVSDAPPTSEDYVALREWMNPDEARERFLESSFIAHVWPEALRTRSTRFFRFEGLIDDVFLQHFGSPPSISNTIEVVDSVLTESDLERLPAWLLGSHGDYTAVIERNPTSARSAHFPADARPGRDRTSRLRPGVGALGVDSNRPRPKPCFSTSTRRPCKVTSRRRRSCCGGPHRPYPNMPWGWLAKRFDLAVQEDPARTE